MSAGPDLKREERDTWFKEIPIKEIPTKIVKKNSTNAKETSIRRQQKWTEKKKKFKYETESQ